VDDEGLYRWFSEVVEAVGSNIGSVILYHIPALTQIELSVELVLRLSEAFPGVVVAVKDSSGNWSHTERLIKERGLLKILVGHEGQLERAMQMGASGAIAGTANILPDIIHSIVHKESQQSNLLLLIDGLAHYPIVFDVKYFISHRMSSPSWLQVNPPLIAVAPEQIRVLSERLDSLYPL
jgi:4-hydroxy-tetrahydrodipicolinate synthase